MPAVNLPGCSPPKKPSQFICETRGGTGGTCEEQALQGTAHVSTWLLCNSVGKLMIQAADEHNQQLKPKNLSPKRSGQEQLPFASVKRSGSKTTHLNHAESIYRKALSLMLSNRQVLPSAFSTRAKLTRCIATSFFVQVTQSPTRLAESPHAYDYPCSKWPENMHFLCQRGLQDGKPHIISREPKPDRNN